MRPVQEVILCKNKLEQWLKINENNEMSSMVENHRLVVKNVKKRIELLTTMLENYTLFQWLEGDLSIKIDDVKNYIYK